MTLLAILFWVWGLYRLLCHVNTMASLNLLSIHILLVTTVVVFYSIYLAPHLYQSVYWRSGLLPYTTPIVFGVWTFVLITSRAVRNVHERPLLIVIGLLSFLGGGFSEAGNATLTAMLIAYVFACVIFRRKKWARDTSGGAIVALLASISAMVLLIVSPTTAYRVGLYEGAATLSNFHAYCFTIRMSFLQPIYWEIPWLTCPSSEHCCWLACGWLLLWRIASKQGHG